MTKSTHFRPARALIVLVAVAVTACETEIAFENDLPGAKLENVKWNAPSNNYSLEEYSDGTLSPGETSESVYVYEPKDEGGSGVIEFDLVQNGRTVHLTTRKKFTAVKHEKTVFTIREDTPVENNVDDGG